MRHKNLTHLFRDFEIYWDRPMSGIMQVLLIAFGKLWKIWFVFSVAGFFWWSASKNTLPLFLVFLMPCILLCFLQLGLPEKKLRLLTWATENPAKSFSPWTVPGNSLPYSAHLLSEVHLDVWFFLWWRMIFLDVILRFYIAFETPLWRRASTSHPAPSSKYLDSVC